MRQGRQGNHFLIPLVAVTALLLNACASSPKPIYLTLDAPAFVAVRGDTVTQAAVVIGPVSVPELVDRPQLVLASGPNRIEPVDSVRWAQPLKNELATALAGHLASVLGNPRVVPLGLNLPAEPYLRIGVEVVRFESRTGAEIVIEAVWTLAESGGKVLTSRRSLVREAVAGGGYEAVAAAHSRAVAHMAAEMAEAVRAVPPR